MIVFALERGKYPWVGDSGERKASRSQLLDGIALEASGLVGAVKLRRVKIRECQQRTW